MLCWFKRLWWTDISLKKRIIQLYYPQVQRITIKRSVDSTIINLNLPKLLLEWIKSQFFKVNLLFNINKNICLGPLVGLIFEPAKSVCLFFLHTRVILVYDLPNYMSSSWRRSNLTTTTNQFNNLKCKKGSLILL